MESICHLGLLSGAPGATMAAAFRLAMQQPLPKPPLIPVMQRKTKWASVFLPYQVMHDIAALLAIVRRQPHPDPC
jgi:hypothetical protein